VQFKNASHIFPCTDWSILLLLILFASVVSMMALFDYFLLFMQLFSGLYGFYILGMEKLFFFFIVSFINL